MDAKQRDTFIEVLKQRFADHPHRHATVDWAAVQARLQAHPGKLKTLLEMENTGGEPDVIGAADAHGAYLFCDGATESPQGRRSLCFDEPALMARKENRPEGSALGMAQRMGAELLTEAQYAELQRFGEFDLKTSSWLATPPEIRARGGALFGDRRYGRVFTYHNGVQSYYAARGFRCALSV
ncbi:hypothetical protein RD110_14015 [Rhodoferax koreense]|uniref:DUF4256 domain-containing protein n=1 Tax=Rhodoferax koreensis TaxID=1842727 RepID=A0A1P8JWR0_9BURK|nr:DUF4256 domain-containing protein [Rhodoferax koreense]APW38175.1 hypothetical protein RD110_14015 [Rhodoferax koreense]